MHYSGAKAKMDMYPNEYKRLLEKATDMGDTNPHAQVIYRGKEKKDIQGAKGLPQLLKKGHNRSASYFSRQRVLFVCCSTTGRNSGYGSRE